VASTPSCTSVDVETESENYFKSVRGDLELDCVSSTSDRLVYLYGLANDVDISVVGGDDDVVTFTFKVTGFTSPSANYPNSDYVWNVYVQRFGTRDIIRWY